MTVFFTADHHFGHANIIRYCERPFLNVKEMDDALVNMWNSVVEKEDFVFHLGDFTLGDLDRFSSITRRLNGRIHIVPGGHDHRWLERFVYLSAASNSKHPVRVLAPLVTIDIKEYGEAEDDIIVLCHYAMRVWDRSHYGSYHLYGHSHGNLPPITNSLDVGVDVHDFFPVSWGEVKRKMLRGEK